MSMFERIKAVLNKYLTKDSVTDEHGKYLKKMRLRKISINTLQILILAALIIGWQLAAKYKIVDPFITSYPSQIIKTIYEMSLNGELFKHIWVTVYETLIGFLLGATGGLVIASILWWSDYLSQIFEPFIIVLNALPKMALGPVLIIWLGNGTIAIIGMALLISIIVTIVMVYNGFKETDQNKIKLLRTLGADKFQIFKKVVLPDNLPTIFGALKVNIGLSLVGTIVGEFLVSEAGLGYLIVYGGQVFKLDLVMTSVIILSVLAGLLYYLVAWLEKKIINWEE
ncbi:ABC transporter permease [Acetohalobium arabaticum]|uniref:Binding-protein-dependent transport systems inner membrane component n=1 Tax=Acetohalobium arabaticum (strain ATCC 49924 / DSM 5501 / Z-7288) TaxID=574087 RepID=D9QQN9_ACEAZ|nr:ABC transporter permease [Acetohalobium arabaticum]ADL12830.1 binding-protein-dependent transport systems inner membrane component [Acetohalobium arabaticum DSM 5501]